MIDFRGLTEAEVQGLIDDEAERRVEKAASQARYDAMAKEWGSGFATENGQQIVAVARFHKCQDPPVECRLEFGPEPPSPTHERDQELMFGGTWVCPECGARISRAEIGRAMPVWFV